MHVFSDASEEAYGAVIYLRSQYRNEIHSNIIVSKASVAPITALSVPRLELLAALKGCELVSKVCGAIKISMMMVTFWTDSLDVLGWINNRSRAFKSFVADKLGHIHRFSKPDQWRFVESKLNPAHLLTHPLSISELIKKEIWFVGPAFLSKDEKTWPPQTPLQDVCQKELRKSYKSTFCCHLLGFEKNIQCCKVAPEEIANYKIERLESDKFSSWIRCLRVRAWVYRFIKNVKDKERKIGELDSDELYDARVEMIRESQIESFQEEYNCLAKGEPVKASSKILALCPFLDEDKIMRCNSRISRAEYLPYDTRFPIILPRGHKLTKLIVRHYHELTGHQGTNLTLSSISAKYWIVAAREEIRSCENECFECKRRKAKITTQIMAPLPKKRLAQSLRAFSYSGVDCGGPYLVKMGRGKVQQKRYICVFTCLNTRAVHIEVAYNIDSDSFLNAFWRFTHRRGIPHKMVSDNGKNFVGAEKEIQNLFSNAESQNNIKRETSSKGIEWSFNPPYTPHSGGVFEIMIKAAKRAMKNLLGKADINDEELLTVVTGAESLINSRPLSYQTANVKDVIPLTPNHFLVGQLGGMLAPEVKGNSHPHKRWLRVQQILSHFWRRWLREILPGLHPRSKWRKLQRNIKIGDIVLVFSVDTERGKWPLGKIVETNMEADGNVRSVKVLVNNKLYTRGLNSLSLIVPNDEIDLGILCSRSQGPACSVQDQGGGASNTNNAQTDTAKEEE